MAIRLGEKKKLLCYEEYEGSHYMGIINYFSDTIEVNFGLITLPTNASSGRNINWAYEMTSTGLKGKYISAYKADNNDAGLVPVFYVDSNDAISQYDEEYELVKQVYIMAQEVQYEEDNPSSDIYYGQAARYYLINKLQSEVPIDAGVIVAFGTGVSVSQSGLSLTGVTNTIVGYNIIHTVINSLLGKYYIYNNQIYQILTANYTVFYDETTWGINVVARPVAHIDPYETYAEVISYDSVRNDYKLRVNYYFSDNSTGLDYNIKRPYKYGLNYSYNASALGGITLAEIQNKNLSYTEVLNLLRENIIYLEINGYVYECGRNFSISNEVYYDSQGERKTALTQHHIIRIIGMRIIIQPYDQEISVGETATFSIEVDKTEGVHYQWQESADGINWTDINSATGSTYSVIGSTENNGHQFRCYITTDDGSEALSDAATLLVNTELRIVEQPQDKEVWVGVSASFVCKASGDTVTYQWQRSNDGTTWTNISGATSTTYTLTAAKTDDGAMFRCVATDRESNSLTSNSATLTANLVLGITQQPTDVSGKLNTTATFHVGAVGEGLTYQWYYSKNFTSFLVAQFDGATTDTMTLPIYGKYNNYKFYCIITDFEANSVTTNTVTLTVEYEHSESEAGAGETHLGQSVKTFTTADEFDGYSKVIINIDDETYVSAGNDDGRTLELECPWGTQQMANNILSSVRGFQYQPYEATGALLDPSAELGDGVTISGTYSGIYKRTVNFGALSASEISAPTDEEVDHEYPYETYTDRKVVRKFLETRADLRVTNALIEAKVSKTGGNNESFGWSLTESAFVLSSNDKEVFRADSSGIKVDGEIRARTGYIGSDSSGFAIDSKSIHNGVQSFSDTAHSGVYIGTDGIVLGKGAFKVDTSGNLTANSGTFKGNVYAGNIQSTAVSGVGGSFNGAGITSSTVGNTQLTADVKSQLLQITENTNNIYALLHGSLTATALYCNQLSANYLFVGGIAYARMGFMDYLGNVRYCLGAV